MIEESRDEKGCVMMTFPNSSHVIVECRMAGRAYPDTRPAGSKYFDLFNNLSI
jgi:hypothetical protein